MATRSSKAPEQNHAQRIKAAAEFAEKWQGRGYEKGDTSSFWLELLRDVVGMQDVTTNVLFEQRTSRRGFIDAHIPDAKTFIEQKSLGVSLDKPDLRQGEMVTPFQQAFNYANTLPNNQRPDFIIVCDFNEFRIHDLNKADAENDYLRFTLAELPEQLHLLDFLIDPQRARAKREEKVSMEAGVLIGKLYGMLREQFHDPDTKENQHALNVLCVRLVFCLFAEDAGLFPKDGFFNYLQGAQAKHVRGMLKELFLVLNTPVEQRDPYLDDDLAAFPYVNGGLFAKQEEIPPFTDEIVHVLCEEVSQDTDWSSISPTIFGGVFESTLNPETRAQGGMHYTSPENIHKVIDPLFLDALSQELEDIISAQGVTDRTRRKRLIAFHDKIASLRFMDPACGSGNFLTETYISLRRIENKILSVLASNNQTFLGFEDVNVSPLKVSLNQFYGIEVNDFAVSVASTALWIAQLQANIETQLMVTQNIQDLPLKDAAHIHHGNALRTDWAEVLPPEQCNYIIGNPPFVGYSRLDAGQKEERAAIFGKSGGVLDYVACWYKRAAEYMEGTSIEAALVSTNSICQGQQVTPLWRPLFDAGIVINFAHRTFIWTNEATDQAHVFCVIVGFSFKERKDKTVWTYRRATAEERANGAGLQIGEPATVDHINGYLADAPDSFIEKRSKPLCDVPVMNAGGKPTEGGNLLLKPSEREELLSKYPELEPYIRRFSMGAEFINGKDRYCLWLGDFPRHQLTKFPELRDRVKAVQEMRLASPKVATQKKAATPWLFDEVRYEGEGTYIGVPPVSSERRKYIPMGFVLDGMIPGNQLYFVPTESRYVFGVLVSQFHNAWMRTVTGRLKSDYRYANTVVYNNFIWPEASEETQAAITECAQAVLDARELYEGATLADMYDPDNDFLYPELMQAHERLDAAVEAAYGVDFSAATDDAEREQLIVAHLFELYNQHTAPK